MADKKLVYTTIAIPENIYLKFVELAKKEDRTGQLILR
jgi:hypothetical protein